MISSGQDISSFLINPASFRDPSGFVFTHEKEIYRAIAPSYFENYSLFTKSGLYKSLSEKKLIISHSEIENFLREEYPDYKIIKPAQIPYISYPYEWCFGQLRDAALLTLKIQKEALRQGMNLKDASAYNVQFIGSNAIFIDTLSFEKYQDGKPWNAYNQFCRHFLAPLALMNYKSAELSKLLVSFIDGIPLELASSLLPRRAILNSAIMAHIIVHSKIQKKYSTNTAPEVKAVLSKSKLLAMLQHMEDCIRSLKIKPAKSNWIKYQDDNTYSGKAMEEKEKIVSEWLGKIKPKTVWDFGCNTGKFSLIASKQSSYVLAADADHYCIENFYSEIKKEGSDKILPLVMDFSAPSPAIGWANKERNIIGKRGKADVLIALALIHHFRIGNNVPFHFIAEYFSCLTTNLIIEFIPEEDSRVKQMLSGREDIFSDYSKENFIAGFEKYFNIDESRSMNDSARILFSMTKK